MSEKEIAKPVSKVIIDTLQVLMDSKELATFRLVGGTSLSLQFKHRQSIDIDLLCLKNKVWELIKLDIREAVQVISQK